MKGLAFPLWLYVSPVSISEHDKQTNVLSHVVDSTTETSETKNPYIMVYTASLSMKIFSSGRVYYRAIVLAREHERMNQGIKQLSWEHALLSF